MDTTHFWLIRHGETEWNANRRLQGWLDVPLSERGIEQAKQLGAYLKSLQEPVFHIALSSDLSRASDTSRLATKQMGLDIVTDERLRERNYGIYQGQDWATLTEGLANQSVDLRDPDQEVEGGESFQAFADRITAAFSALAKEYTGKNVLVFAHGGVVDIAWRKAGGHALTVKREGTIQNASINIFDVSSDGKWQMGDWNQVGHLDAPSLDDVLHT